MNYFLKIVAVILLILAANDTFGQQVGEVKPQSVVFFYHPIWDQLTATEKESAQILSWEDYTGCSLVTAWNSIDKGNAQLQKFDGSEKIYVVKRAGIDFIYRYLCKNRNEYVSCVEQEKTQPAIFLQNNFSAIFNSTTNISFQLPSPQQPCCPPVIKSGLAWIELGAFFRVAGSGPIHPQGGQVGMAASLHSYGTTPAKQTKPFGLISGAELYIAGMYQDTIAGLVVCDTCGVYRRRNNNKGGTTTNLALFAGLEFQGWGSANEKPVWMAAQLVGRYDTDFGKGKGVRGFSVSGEVAVKAKLPVYLLGVKPVAYVAVGGNWHPWPKGHPKAFEGGEVTPHLIFGLSAELGRIGEQAEKIERDSLKNAHIKEQYEADRIVQADYLATNPDTIAVDGEELGVNPSDSKKVAKVKMKLLQLKKEYNTLLYRAQNGEVLWTPIEENVKDRTAAEAKLSRLTVKKEKREARRVERERKKAEKDNS